MKLNPDIESAIDFVNQLNADGYNFGLGIFGDAICLTYYNADYNDVAKATAKYEIPYPRFPLNLSIIKEIQKPPMLRNLEVSLAARYSTLSFN